jgi:uncharacterized repeat protein (TIGR03843 family)
VLVFMTPSHPQPEGESLRLTEMEALRALAKGQMREQGLLPYSSNHSFLITVTSADRTLPAVYKPRRGESPLWDFEYGSLCLRETAAYHVSRILGWDLVPPTVLRDGTRGLGSVQLFIESNDDEHYFTIQEDARFSPALRRLALFDYIINNADRKSGHCLISGEPRLWAIDHGICFHTEYKLRTVIWEFSDEPIESVLLADLNTLYGGLLDAQSEPNRILCRLLNDAERTSLAERTKSLLRRKRYPAPLSHRRNYPWPPI